MNWGIGLGAFANGLAGGIQLGKQINQMRDEDAIRTTSKDALDAAKKDREAAVSSEMAKIMGLGSQSVPGAPPAPGADTGTPGVSSTQPVDMGASRATPPTMPTGPADQPSTDTPVSVAAGGLAGAAPIAAAAQRPARSAPTMPTAGTDQSPAAPTAPVDQPSTTASMLAAAGGLAGTTLAAPAPAAVTAATMTDAQARALAEKKVPTVLDFFHKNGVPKIAEAYLAQGDPEKATAWQKWSQDQASQQHLASWAKMWRASQTGDLTGMANHAIDLYNSMDDGATASDPQPVKNNAGDITGFNVTLKDGTTGEGRSMFIGKDQMLDMGLSALSPPQMFEKVYQRQMVQDKAAADARLKAGEIKMETAKGIAIAQAMQGLRGQNELALENRRYGHELDRDQKKADLDAKNQSNKAANELGAKVDALRAAGYPDDFIRNVMPNLVGVNDYKKRTSPEEARRLAYTNLMQHDTAFSFSSPDQQREKVERAVQIINGGVNPTDVPASAPTPTSGGIGAQPAAKGLPFLDTKTGRVVYR